jgi:diguanylate cyclase (GGDEF)-like protein
MTRSRGHSLDSTAARLRVATIRPGVCITLAIVVAGCGYAVETWERPHRALLLWMLAAGAAAAVSVLFAPAERIVLSRWREPFFFAWTTADIVLVAVFIAADGGARSPLALILFVPLVFAAMSYPLRMTVAIGVLDVLAYMGTSLAVGDPLGPWVWFGSVCLGCTAAMAAWQARHHDLQRALLEEVSRTDPLTGCLNRRGFEERLAGELSRAVREGRPLSLMLVDLDDFKRVNDTLGHAAGDELLRWAVATLGSGVRPADAVGRLGGDEFAVLLPGAGHGDARDVAGRLRDALGDRAPAQTGIACFPADGANGEELLRFADGQLYAAKHGRAAEAEPAAVDLSWATALADALDRRLSPGHSHAEAVAHYADLIARRLGWFEEALPRLRLAAMLHDVGKVGVPDHLLRRPAPLTPAEAEEVAAHARAGAAIVARIDELAPIVPWILHAQEHVDGSGYPDGLTGEAIPLASRILLVADAYDAMVSPRPWRAAMSRDDALATLRRDAGRRYDAECVTALERALECEGAQA